MIQSAQHIPAVVQSLEPIISSYGYIAVGGLLLLEDFGVPAPGETVLIAAAFYAGLGQLNIFLVVLIGILGAVIGDNIGFAIGEYGGHPLVQKYGRYIFITPERLKKAEKFFSHHGGKIVIIARFIEGLRQANGIIAGLSDMKWKKFITFNIIGAVLWVGFWSTIGYLGGNHIDAFLRYQLYVTIAVVLALLSFGGYKLYENKRRKSNA